MVKISRAARIWRIDIEIACVGMSAIDGNQPSPTCWRRHASSSVTTMNGSVVEVGRRVVEREVAVLADADERHVDRVARNRLADRPAHGVDVPLAVELMEHGDPRRLDEMLAQYPAEAGRMRGRQADVLVEVEQLDPRPVDARAPDQVVQEPELRVAGGGDDAGTALGGDGVGKGALCVVGGCRAHRVGVSGQMNTHVRSLR
jgi:hypothetical protein